MITLPYPKAVQLEYSNTHLAGVPQVDFSFISLTGISESPHLTFKPHNKGPPKGYIVTRMINKFL